MTEQVEADPTAPTEPSVLGSADARSYWNQRHAAGDDLRSGGSLSYDRATNAMLYAVRTARLVEAIGTDCDALLPLRVLDAGCGKGHFSRRLTEFGHHVDGIDTSEHAVGECRRLAVGTDTYAVSSLRSWRPPYLYDVVICVDVLFHIMQDEEWEASLRNLASLVRLGGRLVVADHETEQDRVWSDYQKTRAPSRYRAVLKDCGLRMDRFIPNDFKADKVGVHVATRVA